VIYQIDNWWRRRESNPKRIDFETSKQYNKYKKLQTKYPNFLSGLSPYKFMLGRVNPSCVAKVWGKSTEHELWFFPVQLRLSLILWLLQLRNRFIRRERRLTRGSKKNKKAITPIISAMLVKNRSVVKEKPYLQKCLTTTGTTWVFWRISLSDTHFHQPPKWWSCDPGCPFDCREIHPRNPTYLNAHPNHFFFVEAKSS